MPTPGLSRFLGWTTFLLGLAGLFPNPASTQVPLASPTLSPSALSHLPYRTLGTYLSLPGETELIFLERLRPVLRQFSDQTGLEACGEIAISAPGVSPAQWGIVLGSSTSHLGCAIYLDKLPAGLRATGVTIHSHGGHHSFTMNRADRLLAGASAASSQPFPVVYGQTLDHFSPTDYAGGPGYLATPHGLLYQSGTPGSETLVPGSSVP